MTENEVLVFEPRISKAVWDKIVAIDTNPHQYTGSGRPYISAQHGTDAIVWEYLSRNFPEYVARQNKIERDPLEVVSLFSGGAFSEGALMEKMQEARGQLVHLTVVDKHFPNEVYAGTPAIHVSTQEKGVFTHLQDMYRRQDTVDGVVIFGAEFCLRDNEDLLNPYLPIILSEIIKPNGFVAIFPSETLGRNQNLWENQGFHLIKGATKPDMGMIIGIKEFQMR